MEFFNKVLAFFQQEIVLAVVVFLLMALEYWLGKTDLVKPGSTLEAILLFIKKILSFIKGKAEPKPPVEPKV